MKKTILLFVAILIIFSFYGCSSTTNNDAANNENSGTINVTADNIKDFVEINVDIQRYYYDPTNEVLDHSHGYDNVFYAKGNTSGISGYRYENVQLTIEYTIDSSDSGVQSEIKYSGPFKTTVDLSPTGSATIEDAYRLYLGTNDPSNYSYSKITYQIVDASGTIYK